jgi:hypothetical protein
MFDEKEILHLKEVYNSKYSDKITEMNPDKIWEIILKKFSSKCKTGRTECVISHMINKSKSPSSWITNPTDWLSDVDIDRVEHNFVKLFPDYYYVGCVTIDFDLKDEKGKCIVDALCSLKLKTLYKKGKTKIGIIFNTDVHTGEGEHWMALYCDISPEIDQPRITYFDSYGTVPEKEIQKLMLRWKTEWDSLQLHTKEMETTYNLIQHQKSKSECGMNSLYFHYCCLNNISMDERIPDEVMNIFRRFLFKIK